MSDPNRVPEWMEKREYTLLGAIPFVVIHILGIGGAFFVEWTTAAVVTCIVSYVVRLWAVTAGYHRYFSHRTFKTGRVFQFILAFLAQTSIQKGVLWWASHHRRHHKYSDLEGGVRGAAFVSGGYVPAAMRGKKIADPVHLCDWCESLAWQFLWPRGELSFAHRCRHDAKGTGPFGEL